jgi:hypothetical protein
MKFSLMPGLAGIALSLSACTDKKTEVALVDPWVTFDLGSDRLGPWQASGLIHSIRNLIGAERGEIRTRD